MLVTPRFHARELHYMALNLVARMNQHENQAQLVVNAPCQCCHELSRFLIDLVELSSTLKSERYNYT